MAKQQLRFSKRATQLEKVNETITLPISIGECHDIIIRQGIDEIRDSIIIIEQHAEDWGLTEELFQYFGETILQLDKDEVEDTIDETTQKIIKKLYNKFCK